MTLELAMGRKASPPRSMAAMRVEVGMDRSRSAVPQALAFSETVMDCISMAPRAKFSTAWAPGLRSVAAMAWAVVNSGQTRWSIPRWVA